jgi:hypothetical protein
LGLAAPFAAADTPQPKLQCENTSVRIDGLVTYCEMREIPAAFAGSIDAASTPVGGISVRGWDEPGVLIRARVTAEAPDGWQAAALAAQVLVTESAGVVRSAGPAETNRLEWQVSYEIFVPRAVNLALKAGVGEITSQDVRGKIQCGTNVGSLQLMSVTGDVQCRTSVGSISIVLTGNHWEGVGLDVQTDVGAIALNIPADYSAHLELGTGLGSIISDFPLPVVKKGLARSVSGDVGGGGATIHVATQVGAIAVK